MIISLTGKRALVTGAGKGIGREIARALVKSGATVVALSRSAADLNTLQELEGIRGIAVDLSDDAALQQALQQTGDIDLLVNNAGISIPRSFLQTSLADFDLTMSVNVRAALIVSQAVAKSLVARGQPGSIVNVSSQASMVGLIDHTAYCVSKGALDQLTRVMALELGPHAIRVNSLNPTVTLTPMGERAWSDVEKRRQMLEKIPLRKFAKPSDIANAAIYLLSDQASMITGVCLPVDGGFLAAG